MKVTKCNDPKAAPKPAEQRLSWSEMQQEEGVYKLPKNSESRFVVVKDMWGGATVLWYLNGRIEPAELAWANKRFVRIEDVTVCFEIRE